MDPQREAQIKASAEALAYHVFGYLTSLKQAAEGFQSGVGMVQQSENDFKSVNLANKQRKMRSCYLTNNLWITYFFLGAFAILKHLPTCFLQCMVLFLSVPRLLPATRQTPAERMSMQGPRERSGASMPRFQALVAFWCSPPLVSPLPSSQSAR